MNSEKQVRWSMLPVATCHSIASREIEFICNITINKSTLAGLLNKRDNFSKEEFDNLYFKISSCIPDDWFLDTLSSDMSNCFDELPVLQCITARARHKIWIDVPRTFTAFNVGDNPHPRYVELLADPLKRAHLLAVLCRILSVSATLMQGRYCQGMSFVVACYLLYCKAFIFSNTGDSENLSGNADKELEEEALVAATYHYLVLQHHNLDDLFVKDTAMTKYIANFEFQLSAPYEPTIFKTADSKIESMNEDIHKKLGFLHTHMVAHGLDVQLFIVQWFGSCFVLNVSAEMLTFLQEIFLFSSGSKQTRDPMMRLGVAVLYALADSLMELSDFESLYLHLKTNMKKLTPADVVEVFFVFDMKDPQRKRCTSTGNTSWTNSVRPVSSVQEDSPGTMCNPCCVS